MPCGRTVSTWRSVRDAGRTRLRRAAALARHVQNRGQSVRSGCQGLGRGRGARGCERGCRCGDGMFWSYTEEMVAGHCGCTQCHLSSTLKWFLLFYANPTSIETEQRRQKEVWLWASAQTGRSAGGRRPMGAWPGWEGAHKPQAREGPGPLCPVPLPHPHAQGIWGSPSELFAGAGVAGGGPEALAGVPCSSRGSWARPRLVTLECGQGRAGEPVPGTREPAACLRVTDLRHLGTVLCRALGSCRVGLCVRLPWVPRPCVALGLTREGHVWAEPVLSQVYLPFRFFSSSAPPPRLLHIVLTFGG